MTTRAALCPQVKEEWTIPLFGVEGEGRGDRRDLSLDHSDTPLGVPRLHCFLHCHQRHRHQWRQWGEDEELSLGSCVEIDQNSYQGKSYTYSLDQLDVQYTPYQLLVSQEMDSL
jgi:hypothetical protein